MRLKLFGKNFFRIYKHLIMKISYKDVKYSPESDIVLRKIDLKHIAEELAPIGTTVTVANLNRLIRRNTSLCEGFVLEVKGVPVGTIWVMYKGADDLEYRIRNIDAYLFDIYVNDKFRGNGYAGKMVVQLLEYLYVRGIKVAYLAVAHTNKSAISAYKKTGFAVVCNKKFARVLKLNVPYHVL